MFKELIKALGLVKDFSDAKEYYGKRWYTSKTLWLNVIAILALVMQNHFGNVLPPEVQAAIICILNFILRFFTVQPVVATEAQIQPIAQVKKPDFQPEVSPK